MVDLTKLKVINKINFDQDFQFDLEKYSNKDILALNNLHIKGTIDFNLSNNLEVNLEITGEMTIKDSVTLEEIEIPLKFQINEEYEENYLDLQEYYEKEQNILDIMEILWENIVLEVPISFTKSKDVQLSGDGWSFGSLTNNDNIDPRFAKLAAILDEREEKNNGSSF